MKYFGIGLGVLALIVVMWFWGSYNGLVTKSTEVDTSWSTVQTQYQRRFDLVPNLVNATKGAMKQEQAVFTAIAEARTRYAGAPSGSNEQVQATNQYEGALSRLLVVMENYPQLKSIESVQRLTDELAGTENRVAVARDRYNVVVGGYNVYIKRFPKNLIAGMFGFTVREFFKSDEEAKNAPTVNLDTNE
jgi:LemA protein